MGCKHQFQNVGGGGKFILKKEETEMEEKTFLSIVVQGRKDEFLFSMKEISAR